MDDSLKPSSTLSEPILRKKQASQHFAPPERLGGLDGMRALACFAVLAYHAWPLVTPGGFLGVDVFFVLSGFLITGLLMREMEASKTVTINGHVRTVSGGTINIARFWLRRVRRLFPAVALVTVVTIPIAWLVDVDLIARLRSQVAGTLTFTYNWVSILTSSSYFDAQNPRLLANMWTLAVEQQFYLVWPLIIVLIAILSRELRWIVPVILAAISVFIMWWLVSQGEDQLSRAYMGTDSHAFGLMAGAALALFLNQPLSISSQQGDVLYSRISGIAGIVGVGTLIGLFLGTSSRTPFMYPWITLVAVVAAVFVVHALSAPAQAGGSVSFVLRRILDFPVLEWLGVRSYGIYLWHWPLLLIYKRIFPASPPWLTFVLIAVISTICAALSLRFVENPMRFDGIRSTVNRWIRQWKEWSPGAIRIALPIGVAVWCVLICVALIRAPQMTAVEAALSGQSTPAQQDVTPQSGATAETQATASEALDPTGANVIIIGDSVAKAAMYSIADKWPNAILDEGVSRTSQQISELLNTHKSQNSLKHFVVVAAATNASMKLDEIEAWLDIIGPDRVLILVKGYGPADLTWIQDSNAVIDEAAAMYPERIVVADWYTVAGENLDKIYPDQIHPIHPEGADVWVAMVEDALSKAAEINKKATE